MRSLKTTCLHSNMPRNRYLEILQWNLQVMHFIYIYTRQGQHEQGYVAENAFQSRNDMAYERPLTCILPWCMSVLPNLQIESTSTRARNLLSRGCLSSRVLDSCACTHLRSAYSFLRIIARRCPLILTTDGHRYQSIRCLPAETDHVLLDTRLILAHDSGTP